MGLCGSKSGSRSNTEKSERCRWDKHGNVFFPVRRHSQHKHKEQQQQQQAADAKPEGFSTTTNPVFEELDSSIQSKGGHFASFTKLLKVTKALSTRAATTSSHEQQPKSSLCCSRSHKAGYKDLLVATGLRKEQESSTAAENKPCKFKFVEAERNGGPVDLSRSSSSKDGSLTISSNSSAKEAALVKCSSQKEGRTAEGGNADATTSSVNPLKASVEKDENKHSPSHDRDVPKCIDAAVKSGLEDKGPKQENVISVSSSFLTRGIGLPSYQPLIFCAGSPDKCRGRSSSTHSSSGEEFTNARARRRRSPNKVSPRVSPSRRSPSRRSPNKKPAATGIALNSSAARFQRSLPRRTSENLPPQFLDVLTRSAFRPPKSITAKNKHQVERSALKELPENRDEKDRKLPPKPVVKHAGNLGNEEPALDGDARSGSKRLRSPQKPITAGGETGCLKGSTLPPGTSCEDKHVEDSKDMAEKDVLERLHRKSESGSLAERDLLELLERTPKKLKKMALKLALLIELEHSKEEDNYSGELKVDKAISSEENAQTNAYVKCNAHGRKPTGREKERNHEEIDLDLELKLGMGNGNRTSKRGDNVRVGLSFALDSPSRAGSVSLPTTPRQAVSPICNGLSVEARIGSSRGDISCSDISFRILKNPEKLFGNVNHQSERAAPAAGGKIHEETCRDKEMLASQGTRQDRIDVVRSEQVAETKTCMNAPSDCRFNVERCSSFNFNNDKPYGVDEDKDSFQGKLDLNRDAQWENEKFPAFEFQLKSGSSMTSDPATPVMLSVEKQPKETDALSLSADEIAEIWGAFEAGQGTPTKCES